MTRRVVVRILVFVRVRNREDGVIEKVERLKSELHFHPLREGEHLLRGEIKADELGTPERSPASIAKHLSIRGRTEGREVPIVQNVLWTAVGVAQQIAIVLFEIGVVDCRVARVQAGHCKSRSHHSNPADLPAAEQLVGRARPTGTPPSSFTEWKFIQGTVDPV